MTITVTADHAMRQTVRQGRRVVGFIMLVHGAWRFIASRADIAAKCPAPSPYFDTPEAAADYVRTRLGC
jgi:hypothetical protein